MGATFDVVGDEFGDGVGYVGVVEFVRECVKVDGVKGFAHIECYCNGSLWWFVFVEAGGDDVVYVV